MLRRTIYILQCFPASFDPFKLTALVLLTILQAPKLWIRNMCLVHTLQLRKICGTVYQAPSSRRASPTRQNQLARKPTCSIIHRLHRPLYVIPRRRLDSLVIVLSIFQIFSRYSSRPRLMGLHRTHALVRAFDHLDGVCPHLQNRSRRDIPSKHNVRTREALPNK